MDAWKKFSVEVSRRPAIYYLAYGATFPWNGWQRDARTP